MYPRHFLTHHFWTLQQRSEFAVLNLRDRLSHNRPLLRHLQSSMSTLKNDRHYEQWRDILGKLGSGRHPTADEIIGVKELFSEAPYKTRSLSYTHVVRKFSPNLLIFFKIHSILNFIFFFICTETFGGIAWDQSDIHSEITAHRYGHVSTSH